MKQQLQFLDYIMPETADIERQVLADVVASPDQMGDILPLIHADFFTSDDRRGIWATIADHYNRGRAFDAATLAQLIGQPFIQEVMVPKVGGNIFETQEHAHLLRTGAARRRAYVAAATFLQGALNPAAGEADILAAVEGFAARVEGPAPVQTEATLAEAIQAVREEVKAAARAAAEGRSVRIPTGFQDMDQAINGGFKPGQLVILAARPGIGKTSLMIHLAKTAARNGDPVYISTLEMTQAELGEKFLYSTGRVRPRDVADGTVREQDFNAAGNELAGLPIFINQFSRTLDEIVARITQAVKRGSCRVAFIDYLGLVQDTNNLGGGAKLYQIIARITGTLKAVAKRLGIPIVLLCQLNREQVREKRSPELYDLRDSGSIEQDADIVLMLENDYVNEVSSTGERYARPRVIAWLRKNRGGRKGDRKGGDLGFILEPNETYSGFVCSGVMGDTATPPPAPRPEPVRSYNPNAFTESNREEAVDENELPF